MLRIFAIALASLPVGAGSSITPSAYTLQ
jgi:hypothetical protein